MHTQEKASRSVLRPAAASSIRSEKSARGLLHSACAQALPLLPASVTEQGLSLATHAAMWLSAWLGVASAQLGQPARTLALLSAGACAGIGVCCEYLRAMRATQSDALSALRAHWRNALAIPLTSAGMTAALELPAWAVALVTVATCTLYNAKVVLYYHAGIERKPVRAAQPSTAEAQLGLAISYISLAVLFCWIDRHVAWVDIGVIGAALAATFIQLRGNMGYFPKLGQWRREHLAFSALCIALAVLYVTGAFGLHHFLMCSVFTSFRISGTYALRALSLHHVTWSGTDRWLVSFVIAMAISHLVSIAQSPMTSTTHWLAVGICCYAALANLIDFSRHYPSLRSNAESART
jgi:hypothetical protein